MKVLFLEFYLYVDIFWIPTMYIQNYVQIETMTIVIVFEKNRLELDRLNEKKGTVYFDIV